jgi:hypothetical protein
MTRTNAQQDVILDALTKRMTAALATERARILAAIEGLYSESDFWLDTEFWVDGEAYIKASAVIAAIEGEA